MSRQFCLGLAWLASLATMPALGAYKCVDDQGRITYQALPCPADTQGGAIHFNVNQSFRGRVLAPAAEDPALVITPLSSEPTEGTIPATPLDQPSPPVRKLLE